MNLTQFEPFK